MLQETFITIAALVSSLARGRGLLVEFPAAIKVLTGEPTFTVKPSSDTTPTVLSFTETDKL